MVISTRKAAPTKSTKTSATTPKRATKSAASTHPSWVDMIKDCIAAHPEDARFGVSRPTIKKFVQEKYKVEITASAASQLNRTIVHGSERGVFTLPKGPSGKVKLAPKTAIKENATPAAVMKTSAGKQKPAISSRKSIAKRTATRSTKKSSTAKKPASSKKASSSRTTSIKKLSAKSVSGVKTNRAPIKTAKPVREGKSASKKAAE